MTHSPLFGSTSRVTAHSVESRRAVSSRNSGCGASAGSSVFCAFILQPKRWEGEATRLVRLTPNSSLAGRRDGDRAKTTLAVHPVSLCASAVGMTGWRGGRGWRKGVGWGEGQFFGGERGLLSSRVTSLFRAKEQ